MCRLTELRHKEVVNIKDGARLGFVCDCEIDVVTSNVVAIIVFGERRFFGLFGRAEDIVIPWCDIEKFGEDIILVCFEPHFSRCRKSRKSPFSCLED